MANVQEEVTRQVWELFLKFMGTGTEFIYQISHEGNVLLRQGNRFTMEFLTALINKQKENGEPTDIAAQMLKREQKGESIFTMAFADEDAAELSERFGQKGILFNLIENPNDDTKIFMYMSGDAEHIGNQLKIWQAEKGLVSELEPELFLDNFAEDGVGTLSGLDRSDLVLFRDYAKQNGLIFTSTETEEKGKYMVVYDPKDKATAKKTMASVLWALSGEEGARLRKQLVVFLKNRQQINRSFLEAEKEFYIVSGKNPETFVHLTANDYTYYKNAKEIKNERRDSDSFVDSGLRAVDGIVNPVLLTREEYEVFKTDGELDKEAIAATVAAKANAAPDLAVLKEIQSKQDKRLALVQEKMALDDENTAGFWIYDDGIDFAAAGDYEDIEDIDDQTRADLLDAKARAAQYHFYEVSAINNRSLDYFIAEAEKHRSAQKPAKEEPERDM